MSAFFEKSIGGGLTKLPGDARDFSHEAVFGSIALDDIPNTDFFVSEPLDIKDQGNSSMCAAFAVASVSEDQERVKLSPEFIFAKAKEIEGNFTTWGMNLRDICKVLVKIGAIEKSQAPFEL